MRRHVTINILMICCGLFYFVNNNSVTANANESQGSTDIPYSVTPVFSKSQLDRSVSYFDLLVSQGETEIVEINISNHSEKLIVVNIEPYTARTTSNGTVDYSGMDLKSSESLKLYFEDLVLGDKRLEIPPKSTKNVIFSLLVPEKKFDGILLGAFNIQEESIEKKDKYHSDFSIKNTFSYIIACQLRMDEKQVPKQFFLDSVKVGSYGGYFSIMLDIINDAPVLISDFSLESKIINKDEEEVHTIKNEKFSMAPNSIYSYSEEIDKEILKPGEYTMKMLIKSKSGKKEWNTSKKFNITEEKGGMMIDHNIKVKKESNMVLCSVIIASILIIVFIFS